MSKCKWTKQFEEPQEKYVCLSACLFYKEKYIKVSKNLKTYDASKTKVLSFIKNLLTVFQYLVDGTYPSNFYLRLYYDKSIFKNSYYREIYEKMKKHPKVQWIEYRCEKFLSNEDTHIDLFGTFTRFYTIFDNESPNMEYCIVIDVDNYLNKQFFEIFQNFQKSNYLVKAVNRINQISFHSNDFQNTFEYFDFIYLVANMIMVRKHPIFDIQYWNQYFDHMFEQQDLVYVYNYIDFKRYAMNGVLGKKQLEPQSYYSFNYGADEIWINFVIKKILINHQAKDKLDCYLTHDYQLKFMKERLQDCLEYNSIVNKEEYKLFIKHCSFLTKKNHQNLIQYMNSIQQNKEIISLFHHLTQNPLLERIYIQNNMKYIITHFHELLQKRGKYTYFQILGIK
jgi:hypothetical protein